MLALHFVWKLFASHEIKVLPSRDRALAERLLLATGRLSDLLLFVSSVDVELLRQLHQWSNAGWSCHSTA